MSSEINASSILAFKSVTILAVSFVQKSQKKTNPKP